MRRAIKLSIYDVWSALVELGPSSQSRIAAKLGCSTHVVRHRLLKLLRCGAVRESATTRPGMGGRAHLWRAVSDRYSAMDS
jgi:predicted ArsR family transcriptional regulator